MAQRVGIKDVALAAGVSVSTVSHALSGKGHMRAETRDRVRAVAVELGYTPNRLASSLRQRRTRVIGLVSDSISTTPFATRVVVGVHEAASAAGLQVMMTSTHGDPSVELASLELLASYRVDGVVYAKMFHQTADVPAALLAMPSVFVDALPREPIVPATVPDERQIGRVGTEFLLGQGHRNIAHLSIVHGGPGRDGRVAGFMDAMHAASIENAEGFVAYSDDTSEAYARRARDVLTASPRPTAVFCFNDRAAIGVYHAAASLRLRIPEDVSVVGVDNLELVAETLNPGLTTVSLPHFEMGVWAVRTLVKMIAGEPFAGDTPSVVFQPGVLIERASVAPPGPRVTKT